MKELPKSVKEELKQIREFGLRILAMKDTAQLAETIVAEHQDKFERLEVSLGYNIASLQGVLIMAHDVQNMRDILPIIRELRRHGWKVKSHNDFPEAKRRSYHLRKEKESIHICAFLPWEDGANCKFVQVGVEEKPVYELKCDGETFAEEITERQEVTA